MHSTLLTVAIPTYNGGKSLLDAVESCRHIYLSDNELEVLVVDNCSNDGSIENAQRKFKDFKSLRIVRNKKNYGRVGNWNRCLKLARGEFILFLFTNDLILENNGILGAINLFKENSECAIVNTPCVCSDYSMSKMYLDPQFFCRTTRLGYYNCNESIKSIVEKGELPFQGVQSNYFRTSIIKKGEITFDPELPITADAIFLSELALQTGIVGFYDKPSIIWRYDAPNRLHSQVKWNEHAKQVFKAFARINGLLINNEINLTKALANYKGPEYFISSLIKAKSSGDIIYSKQILSDWWRSIKKYDINMIQFVARIFWRLIKLPLKIKTFLLLLYNRVKKYPE